MTGIKIGIAHQFENQKTKYVVYFTFLVFVTILVAYSIMLLFQDISILGQGNDQILPSYMSSSGSSSVPSYHSNPLDPTDIEIVYPNSNQTARIESNFEISGISNYDPSNVCSVSVIANDIKPYKKTIPTGGNKTSEYFTWKYVIEPDSNPIRLGNNKVTARLLCAGESGEDIRKWDSIAVTGQSAKEIESEHLKNEALTVPIKIKSIPGISSSTIEIDRNLLVELINERIGNSSEDIKGSIRDSILSIYNG